ncbi:beta-lactamase/transpeptidase-like protein [Corynespora cassiicola Philippines]|uniref:Beta-lactamase/transpeptidase-like protein n=1 Tax=Corynespora cassiicola Philippines TaxID=1448308 RepID=A0A2T2N9P5_CORCC|nr:beta-lactamase/transpeptidase-like protein [Corynespora cassiicola Philippines]
MESKVLPGYCLMTGDKNGRVLYSRHQGVQSLKEGSGRPFQPDTICALASMTKLLTAVAVMQFVEAGIVDQDESVSKLLPDIGKYGIITGFDDEKNEAITTSISTPITLRMLLNHTNGQEYDWFNPLLGKWRASRGELPWVGPTVEQKSVLPLLFEPGPGFRYSAGSDWAGILIERATGTTLEEYMKEKIWGPLGIKKITFYPKSNPDMQGRIASISTLNEKGEGPAVDAADFDILFGAIECLGGGGAFGSTEGYFTFLQAVLRRDSKLLTGESWKELFKPQLNESTKKSFNDYLKSSPLHTQYLGMGLPTDLEKNSSFAGMICENGIQGRMRICGIATCQIIPPMSPSIMALHEQFQRAIHAEHTK